MSDHVPTRSWCERLDEAISDGRYSEDPGFWRSHLDACPRCQRTAEGYLLLRRLIDISRPPEDGGPSRPRPTPEPPHGVSEAFERYARDRRGRARLMVVGAVLLLALGGWWVTRKHAEPVVSGSGEADMGLAYAARLYERVHPRGGTFEAGRIEADPGLYDELLSALRSPHAVVRRVAYMVLAIAGRPVPIEETLRLLREARPGLEAPLVIASAGDAGRHLAEALDAGRTNLLGTVLEFLPATTAQSGEKVPVEILLPYIHDPAERVRLAALSLLERDPGFAAGPEIEALLGDPSLEVRQAAAGLVAARGGEGAGERLAQHFGSRFDPDVEVCVVASMGSGPRAVALARSRLEDARVADRLALRHALSLLRAGVALDADALVARGIRGDDECAGLVASLAATGNWIRHRAALQERWRQATGVGRNSVGAPLVRWDVASGDAGRIELALELFDGMALPAERDTLKVLQGHADPAVKQRADEIARRWAGPR